MGKAVVSAVYIKGSTHGLEEVRKTAESSTPWMFAHNRLPGKN